MANMSYCRFNNTSLDMRDCIETMENQEIESKSEYNTMKNMIELCEEFIALAEEYKEEWVEEE